MLRSYFGESRYSGEKYLESGSLSVLAIEEYRALGILDSFIKDCKTQPGSFLTLH
jgi:hypothetical protein